MTLFPISEYWWLYSAFLVFVLAMLALDLGVFHRTAKEVKFKEAAMGLEAQSKMLSEAVKTGDKSKVQAAFAETGKNGCGTCHNTFREKLN